MDNLYFCSVVIVAYNPDERLNKSVITLLEQDYVKDIVIVDNSTINNSIIDSLSGSKNITVISNHGNKGIAFAQNEGIRWSKERGYKWALTLDHDTIISGNLLRKYYEYINANDCSRIGIISTDYYDIGSKKNKFGNSGPIQVNLTISSGSLINIEIFGALQGMKDHYFIDQVDNEYCYRLLKNDYKIVVLPGVGMEHRLGNIKELRFLNKSFFIYNQSPKRVYYRTRNLIWFIKDYKKDNRLMLDNLKLLIIDFVKIVFEKNSLKKYYNFCKGIKDGIFSYCK